MTNSLDIIALEAGETSRVAFSTIAELASAICEEHLDSWSHRVLQEAGIHLEVTGREHIRQNENYIVMSNRQSRYDIPVLYQALGIPMQMMETKEIAGLPFKARLSGKQILPVTIDGTQQVQARGQLRASPENTARVTISAPIDPAKCSSERMDGLITVVKDVIERHLPAPPELLTSEISGA